MAKFEPDELITSIKVQLHTANVSDASTDSDILVELFDWPEGFGGGIPLAVEIDTDDYNDFEAGGTKWYTLPTWYFGGRIVNDIVRVCLHKGDDGGSDWGLGWVSIWVNGKDLFTSPNMAGSPDKPTWLSDGEKWYGNFARIEFVAPKIENLGLPDAGRDENYSVVLKATGGRKPLTWQITASNGNTFTAPPKLTSSNADGTEALFTAHTVNTTTTVEWNGSITVTDADARSLTKDVSMRVVFALPAPTIKKFEPTFGWPAMPPAEPTSVVVTIDSTGKDFDSRKPGATKVFFQKAGGSLVEAEVQELTSSQARVQVPKGAVQGGIQVETIFGKATSAGEFFAHPNGYRFISGFSFHNRAKDDDSSDGFPNTFAWERYEQTFGLDEMWLVMFDQAVMPNPISTFFYITTHDSIGSGCCHGFCLTSLQMKKGIIPLSAFAKDDLAYPLDDSLWDLSSHNAPSSGLSKWIQTRQIVNFSDEALSFFLEQLDTIPNIAGALCHMDARPALTDVNNALNSGLSNPRMIAFSADCLPWRGHVVIPYGLEPGTGEKKTIRVYNPNKPAKKDNPHDEGSFITVDPESGEWSHVWSDGEIWDGLYMFTIPLTEYGHQTDWSLPGLGSLLDLVDTFILGCAGTDTQGEIVQVTDQLGRKLFDEHGSTLHNRALWPAGARPVPQFSPSGNTRKLVAITKPAPLIFTIKPRSLPGGGNSTPAFFSLTLGADIALSVEDVTAPLQIRFDPASTTIEVAPLEGKTSAIVRLSRRFPKTTESLSFALRIREVVAGKAVVLTSSQDGLRAVARASDTELTVDVEVTHTSRIGEVRIFESDDILTPAHSVATFHVSNVEDLDLPEKAPLILDVDPDGSGAAVTRRTLRQKLSGLTVIAPYRVIARPQISLGAVVNPVSRVPIDVSRSTTAFPGSPMRFQILGGPRASLESGKLWLSLPRGSGSQPLRVVAVDDAGHRSFPRTVFVTVAEENQRVIPPLTLFGEDRRTLPGTEAAIALGTYVIDVPIIGINADFTIRERRSGIGTERAELLATELELSPEIKQIGGQIAATVSGGGLSLHLEIKWDPTQPRSGRINLGHLRVRIPEGVALASTFVLRGNGAAISLVSGHESQSALNVLPALIHVWGGAEPASLEIQGPRTVGEEAEITVHAAGQGVSADHHNTGWWIERISGYASVQQNPADGTTAIVTGLRAGLVKLKVVVGTQTAETVIRIQATVRPNLLGLSARLRNRRRLHLG